MALDHFEETQPLTSGSVDWGMVAWFAGGALAIGIVVVITLLLARGRSVVG